MASHYVIMYTATAGANGPLLGTDEEDIVLMQFLVWDAVCRKFARVANMAAIGDINRWASGKGEPVRSWQRLQARHYVAAQHSSPSERPPHPVTAVLTRHRAISAGLIYIQSGHVG
ncbi:hypothetical protein E2C01_040986 [Portunus trituberculatus]|uniref:Uncharacterized protein n=1 Tax=Portunus trituberculatus TaxID=210409 RepID=A0A5B7FP30_PORTR|nr:hypothetical protein [Portunus trituberculatus]